MRRGDLEGRLNPEYHAPEVTKLKHLLANVKCAPLGDLLEVCHRYPTFYGIEYKHSGVRVLKGENINEFGEISEVNEPSFIDEETNARFPLTNLLEGDLLMSVRGEVGKVGFVTNNFAGSNINANTIRLSLKDDLRRNQITPIYVWTFLNSPIGKKLLRRKIAGGVQETITVPDILEVLIPLPPLEIQHALVAEMETARESRRAKFNEAEALLKSLDGWLLAQLGVTIPPKSTEKVFATRLGEARGRIDAAFHSPRFRALREGLEHGIYTARTVGSFCISIKSGFAAGKQDQAENDVDGVPHLRPLNISIYGDLSLKGTKYVPRTSLTAHDFCQQGEVLFNNTNSEELVGKSTVFDLDVDCACSNHMTRLQLTPDASPYFIAALFNSLRSTGYLGMLATNFVNQAGINTETLSALRIPFPAPDIQQTILSEISQRRAEAHRLRAEAEAEWQAAKERFEHQLLTGK